MASVLITDSRRLHVSLPFREKIRLAGCSHFIVSHSRWVENFCPVSIQSSDGLLFALGGRSLTDQLWFQMWGQVIETRTSFLFKKVKKLEKVHVTGILKNWRERDKW